MGVQLLAVRVCSPRESPKQILLPSLRKRERGVAQEEDRSLGLASRYIELSVRKLTLNP